MSTEKRSNGTTQKNSTLTQVSTSKAPAMLATAVSEQKIVPRNLSIAAAKTMFDECKELREAVDTQILPTLVSMQTDNGIVGTGFFYYSQWLVSNAHIISCEEMLTGTHTIDHKLTATELKVERAFIRPYKRNDAPDVVIIKTSSHTGLPSPLSGTSNKFYGPSYIFYIDIHSDKSDGGIDFAINPKIKFLEPLSASESLPLIYKCEDESIPLHGSSGSPIIEARILLGRELKWHFSILGTLYARCDSDWYNKQEWVTTTVPKTTKLVCAIPVKQEFLQVQKILVLEEDANREKQMAAACDAIKKAEKQKEIHAIEAEISEIKAKLGIREFSEGVTELSISLPDGLERLWYSGIVEISKSLLLRNAQQQVKELKKVNKKDLPDISYPDLIYDYQKFMGEVKAGKWSLQCRGSQTTLHQSTYFRMDLSHGSDGYWLLQIQDQTGKGFKIGGKSASSVFATVKVPKDKKEVNGNILVQLFEASQKEKEEQLFADVEQKMADKKETPKIITEAKDSISTSRKQGKTASHVSCVISRNLDKRNEYPAWVPPSSSSSSSSGSSAMSLSSSSSNSSSTSGSSQSCLKVPSLSSAVLSATATANAASIVEKKIAASQKEEQLSHTVVATMSTSGGSEQVGVGSSDDKIVNISSNTQSLNTLLTMGTTTSTTVTVKKH